MRIHFYGSSASEGSPATFCECDYCRDARRLGGRNLRTRTSCGINDDLLVDFSADSHAHMLYGGLDLGRIDHLLVTHSHIDHFYPEELLHVAPPFAFYSRQRALTVYGNDAVKRKFVDAGCAGERARGYLQYRELQPGEPCRAGRYLVTPLPANHAPDERCFIYIIEDGERTLLYGHDSAYFGEAVWRSLAGRYFHAVVLDCTCGAGDSVFGSHMGFTDNRRIRERMLREGTADTRTAFIATHFCHTFSPYPEKLEAALAPHGFTPAYDGYELEV